MNKTAAGHLLTLLTVFIWGITFVSTKILLRDFTPVEILFSRFAIAYAALWLISPRLFRPVKRAHELYFAGAGLLGVTLYFILENEALNYTLASNTSIIVSTQPMLTGILAIWLLRAERPGARFFAGFVIAMAGICMISLGGSGAALSFTHLGDLLAVLAAVTWALYCIIVKKVSGFGYNTIQMTRRIFFYGLLFIIPALFIFKVKPGLSRYADPVSMFNLLFLGLLASGLCYVAWNFAVEVLGAVKTSAYIYIIPVVTIVASAIILKERITPLSAAGSALILLGLFISERRKLNKKIQEATQDESGTGDVL